MRDRGDMAGMAKEKKTDFSGDRVWPVIIKSIQMAVNPLDDIKLLGNTIGSLVRANALRREMSKV
jgi:hypothetical protein